MAGNEWLDAARRRWEIGAHWPVILRLGGGLLAVLLIGIGATALSSADDDSTPTDQEAVSTSPSPTTTAPPAPTTAPATTTTPAPATLPPNHGRVGVFVPAPGSTPVIGSGSLVTYSVEVEEAVGIDAAEVGGIVDAALADPRSWTASGGTSFQRLESGGQVRIVLATPPTVDEMCLPLQTNGIFSCREGNQVNLNADRWLNGTDDWPLGIEAYRAHVINHEMGHALGNDHAYCPGPGELAPVMMQQTKGLEGCVANPWPFP